MPRTSTDRSATHPTAILAVVCVAYFTVILDNSAIFTGLPQIQTSMHFSSSALAWVTDAYVLVFGGLLPLGARAGDLVSRRRLFVLGLGVFAVASLLVGVAPFMWWLIAARAIQGVGAAILAPSSLALLTANFAEGRERSRAVAAYSAVAGIGASAGLVIGGVLADQVSWRAGFFLNVPIGAAMLLAALRIVPETERLSGRFDLTGAVAATFGMTALVFGVIHAADAGWAAPMTAGAIAVGAVALFGLVFNEMRAEQPIMPLRLFTSSERVGAYLTRMLYLGAMMGFFFFTTQYLQEILGFSPLQAGVGFLPMSAVNFAVAMVVTRAVRRYGPVPVLTVGVAATLAGMAWLSRVGAHSSYWAAVAAPMVLIGIGQGLAFAPMTSAGLAGVQERDAGASSGLINSFHQLGSALGLSILVAVGAAAVAAHATPPAALLRRVATALLASSVLLALALAAVLLLIARRRTAAPADEPPAASTPMAPAQARSILSSRSATARDLSGPGRTAGFQGGHQAPLGWGMTPCASSSGCKDRSFTRSSRRLEWPLLIPR